VFHTAQLSIRQRYSDIRGLYTITHAVLIASCAVFSRCDESPACYRQTDGQTDTRPYTYAALCIICVDMSRMVRHSIFILDKTMWSVYAVQQRATYPPIDFNVRHAAIVKTRLPFLGDRL